LAEFCNRWLQSWLLVVAVAALLVQMRLLWLNGVLFDPLALAPAQEITIARSFWLFAVHEVGSSGHRFRVTGSPFCPILWMDLNPGMTGQ